MWAIGVEFLTGNCVATNIADRESAEWPPHPMRLFMAMAAAYFETGGEPDQRRALEWIESLPPPDVLAPEPAPRRVVTAFVPVNDGRGAESMPKVRSRQPRTFPTTFVGNEPLFYVWNDAIPSESIEPLQNVLCNVSRIGHSSSLVWAWLVKEFQPASVFRLSVWQLDSEQQFGTPMRRMFGGALAQLESAYNLADIERHAELAQQLSAAKGKAKTAIKQQLEQVFGGVAPTSRRPEFRATARYRKVESQRSLAAVRSWFDDELLVLTQLEGPTLGCETTLRAVKALRGAILSQFPEPAAIPEWIGGHQPDGTASTEPHLAIVPLPYVGEPYADGHLLGFGLVFPRQVSPRDRARGLAQLLTDSRTGEDKPVVLKLGNLGTITLQLETRPAPPRALRPRSWTRPSHYWSTVTPIVLDRYPKSDPARDRASWLAEVADIIATSCTRIGLPEPIDIAIHYNPWLRGVPRTKSPGNSFPLFQSGGSSGSGAPRPMVHALFGFDTPIRGPILLGTGRFQGYGFCKPLTLNHSFNP